MSKELALHYDLTVPMARYVVENFSHLAFPFKRYQIQKVWRGERPQFGRYREFYQADFDVVDVESLAQLYDAQVLCVGVEAMLRMQIAPFRVGVSNRKIYEGYLRGLGASDTVPILRIIDKLDKIGAENVIKGLVDKCGLEIKMAEQSLRLASTQLEGRSVADLKKELAIENELLDVGLSELESLLTNVRMTADTNAQSVIYPDLSFVRGFDYYTGSIYEGKFSGDNTYGSICSGGRYDNLAEGFGNQKLPGVGFSIGLTRILAKESQNPEQIHDYPREITDFCLILDEQTEDPQALVRAGKELQANGYSVNSISVAKLKKGLQIASRTGACVALLMFDRKIVLKQLASGEQFEVSSTKPLLALAADMVKRP